jgi:hypothetical protein
MLFVMHSDSTLHVFGGTKQAPNLYGIFQNQEAAPQTSNNTCPN